MQGADPVEAVLRFSPKSAAWVADFRELTQKILSHGSDVKVISPPELKNLIKKNRKNDENLSVLRHWMI